MVRSASRVSRIMCSIGMPTDDAICEKKLCDVLQGMMRKSAPMLSRRLALFTISGRGLAPPRNSAAVRSGIAALESIHTRGCS